MSCGRQLDNVRVSTGTMIRVKSIKRNEEVIHAEGHVDRVRETEEELY